jgi:hypothetical protein
MSNQDKLPSVEEVKNEIALSREKPTSPILLAIATAYASGQVGEVMGEDEIEKILTYFGVAGRPGIAKALVGHVPARFESATREEIYKALAQGYCTKRNSKKTVDVELLEDIGDALLGKVQGKRGKGHKCPWCKATTCYEHYNCNGCETHAEYFEGKQITRERFSNVMCEHMPSVDANSGMAEWSSRELDKAYDALFGHGKREGTKFDISRLKVQLSDRKIVLYKILLDGSVIALCLTKDMSIFIVNALTKQKESER